MTKTIQAVLKKTPHHQRHRFYRVEQHANKLCVEYGPVGSAGRQLSYRFDSALEAKEEGLRRILQKMTTDNYHDYSSRQSPIRRRHWRDETRIRRYSESLETVRSKIHKPRKTSALSSPSKNSPKIASSTKNKTQPSSVCSSSSTSSFTSTSTPTSSLLLWVDDVPGNNTRFVDRISLDAPHVRILQITTTEEAIQYLEAHPELKDASPTEFRIITDRTRHEPKASVFQWNPYAGEELVMWVRENGYSAPILMFCGRPDEVMSLEHLYPDVRIARDPSEGIDFGSMK
eukprot:gb/GECH01003969.1/.p1 GENE.gb/GECH01003969.1/~~gb/GECH01003969.1/.p1  ORF type:complete len:287 (+),score=55.81 gb/GECH01003969.1/:1-861(+)